MFQRSLSSCTTVVVPVRLIGPAQCVVTWISLELCVFSPLLWCVPHTAVYTLLNYFFSGDCTVNTVWLVFDPYYTLSTADWRSLLLTVTFSSRAWIALQPGPHPIRSFGNCLLWLPSRDAWQAKQGRRSWGGLSHSLIEAVVLNILNVRVIDVWVCYLWSKNVWAILHIAIEK